VSYDAAPTYASAPFAANHNEGIHSQTGFSLSGKHSSHINIAKAGEQDKRRRGSAQQGEQQGTGTFFTELDLGDPVIDENNLINIATGRSRVSTRSSPRALPGAPTPGALLRQSLHLLPKTYTKKVQPLPAKIKLGAVMKLAQNTIGFENGPQRRLFQEYFEHPASRNIISDSYWFVLCHFFGNAPKPQKAMPLSKRLLLKDGAKTATAFLGDLAAGGQGIPALGRSGLQRPATPPSFDEGGSDDEDERMLRIKQVILSRIADSYVQLFMDVNKRHKDDFFKHFFDGLAQTLFYSLTVQNPDFRAEIDTPEFKAALLTLCCQWTLGHVPASVTARHWKILKREPKKNTALQRALNFNTDSSPHQLDKKLSMAETKFMTKKMASANPGGTPSRGDLYKGRGKSMVVESGDRAGGAVSDGPGGAAVEFEEGMSAGRARSMPVRNTVPMQVVRKSVTMNHSSLVQYYLEDQGFAAQSNHAVKLPMTTPEVIEHPVEAFLLSMKEANAQSKVESEKIKTGYASVQTQYAKVINKEMRLLKDHQRKNDTDHKRALREATAFSKNLVAAYHDRKYTESKNPSKSLALRKLGHFKISKDEQLEGGIQNRDEGSKAVVS
jgi:hypothetical protein